MAKAAFISLYDESAYGIRMLSACLKKAGHERHIIFLKGYKNSHTGKGVRLYKDEKPWEGIGPYGNSLIYAIRKDITKEEKYILIGLIKKIKPDFVGLTVNTPLRWRAIVISKLIKTELPDIPVIWGGFEPTINPKESLRYCDVVCRGEAELAIVEIADHIDKKKGLRSIKNLCFKDGGTFIENELNPLCGDLDKLPFQDCSSEGNYFIEDNKLYSSPKFLFPDPNIYSTITARGCVFQCSYCCESYLKNLYKPHLFLRRRSPKNVIAEIEEVKKNDDIDYIIFQDEIISFQTDWLKKFAPLYRKKIGIPFTAFMFPSDKFRERLELLKEAGLSSTCLAVQSGSQRICKVYNRLCDKKLFLEAAGTLRDMNLTFYTDVITYNPMESKQDLEETLDFLLDIPQPYDICINKLYILPGTKLSEQLPDSAINKKRGYIFDYYCGLFFISSYFKSARIWVGLIKSIKVFENYPVLLKPILYIAYFFGSLNKTVLKLKKIKNTGRLNAGFLTGVIKRKLKFI